MGLLENGGQGDTNKGKGAAASDTAARRDTPSGPSDTAAREAAVAATAEAAAAAEAAEAELEAAAAAAAAHTVETLLRAHGWRFTHEPSRVLFHKKAPRVWEAAASFQGASAAPPPRSKGDARRVQAEPPAQKSKPRRRKKK